MRFYRHKYLIFVSFFLLLFCGLSFAVYADEPQVQEGSAVISNNSTAATDSPKVCSNTLTDTDKERLAKAAAESVNTTKDILSKVNYFVNHEYRDSKGSCYFIQRSSSKWWRELFTSAVTPFNDHAVKGAEIGDSLVSGLNLVSNVKWINNNSEYLDWDFPELLKRMNRTKAALDTIRSWQDLPDGSIVDVSDEVIGPIKEVNIHIKCDKLSKISGTRWKCADSTPGSFDFAYSLAQTENISKCQEKLTAVVENRSSLMSNRKNAHHFLSVLSGEVKMSCTCEEKTDEKKCNAIDTDIEEDDVKVCPALSEYQTELKNCVICNLMRTILAAVQNVAQKSFDALAVPLITLLGIGFALFLGYITLMIVSSPATQKISAYFNPVLIQGFCVAVAILLLSYPSAIYELAVSPIIDTGVDFGVGLSNINNMDLDITAKGEKYEFSENSNNYLSSDILKKTVGAADAFSQNVSLMPAIGRSLMCNAWNELYFEIFQHIEMWINGLILYVFGMIIMFVIGFYLLDACVQLGIICALMPFLIASWAFKLTRTYSVRGWDVLLNTFFNFVMMGIIIVSVTEILIHSLGEGISVDTLKDALNANDVDMLNRTIDFGGLQMILLLVSCAISLKLIGTIPDITNKFAGGLGLNTGNMIGGAAAAQFKNAALSTGKIGAKVAGVTLKAGARETAKLAEASGALGAFRAGKNAVRQAMTGKLFGNRGTNGQQNADQSSNDDGQNRSQDNNDGQGAKQENSAQETNE